MCLFDVSRFLFLDTDSVDSHCGVPSLEKTIVDISNVEKYDSKFSYQFFFYMGFFYSDQSDHEWYDQSFLKRCFYDSFKITKIQ